MRYVIADNPGSLWGHIFRDGEPEIMTRFVFDLEDRRLVAGGYQGGYSQSGPWWADMSAEMLADLQDSLVNANPDALDNPEYWGLLSSDELPEWAARPAAPRP